MLDDTLMPLCQESWLVPTVREIWRMPSVPSLLEPSSPSSPPLLSVSLGDVAWFIHGWKRNHQKYFWIALTLTKQLRDPLSDHNPPVEKLCFKPFQILVLKYILHFFCDWLAIYSCCYVSNAEYAAFLLLFSWVAAIQIWAALSCLDPASTGWSSETSQCLSVWPCVPVFWAKWEKGGGDERR